MVRLEELSTEDRRGLLVKLLRKKAREQDGADLYSRRVNPYLAHSLAQLDLDKRFVRGEGCYLYDAEGECYLDFIAQYGALPFGYNPARIWAALERLRQAGTPSFVQPSLLTVAGELAERLVRAAPEGLEYVTFANSGAEAVEIAIKLCRSATGRPGILSTTNSFHGKTLGALSATGRAVYQEPFMAPAAGFEYVRFGDAAALEETLAAKPDYFAGFLVEPIQGEGGIVEPPEGYLGHARDICRRAGVLLVLDEVQTGLGRTGTMFACQHEQVTPDLMTLAKALGGGLMPIGACLSGEAVYNEDFALRHSSTFAGNALAAQAGLATLDWLEDDDHHLVRQVAENGARLKEKLIGLQAAFPRVVEGVRGKGYFLGLQISLDAFPWEGLLAFAAEQELDEMFGYAVTSYLLNVEKVRIAPTASVGNVLRIEPPLVAGWNECERFLAALERALDAIDSGSIARLSAHLVLSSGSEKSLPVRPRAQRRSPTGRSSRAASESAPTTNGEGGRFAFLIHLATAADFMAWEPSLKAFSEAQVLQLKRRLEDRLHPVPISEVAIESACGAKAWGEFILAPYTAGELAEMDPAEAREKVVAAVDVGTSRGAQIVGLGGFASVVTQGGTALSDPGRPPLTTGNSYTVASTRRTLELACELRGRRLASSSAAVVGAAGSLGRATALLVAESAPRVILIGSPINPERSLARLSDVAQSILRHLWNLHTQGREFPDGTLGARLVKRCLEVPRGGGQVNFAKLAESMVGSSGPITIATSVNRCLHEADIVVTATSSVHCFIGSENIKPGAIVCEMSRPFNIGNEVKQSRPDVMFLEGGKVRIPGTPDLGFDLGYEKGIALACMAETMILALERSFCDTSLGVELNIETIHEFERLADKHGFVVVT